MKTVEFKVPIPEGMEIDKKNSTFELIKFKPIKSKKWRGDENAKISGYYISGHCNIHNTNDVFNAPDNYNVFATEKQAKSAIAMARISQIMANDKRFGGVITDEEWSNYDIHKYIIVRKGDNIESSWSTGIYRFLAFHTKEQCDLFLKENKDLIEDYLML